MSGERTKRVTPLLLALALTTALLGASYADAQQTDDGTATVESNQLGFGDGGHVTLTGTGFTTCAGTSVSISLLFRATTETGYEPFASAARISPSVVSVDASGSFRAAIADPEKFPGWLGYVAMEGGCVKLMSQRLLARVVSVVPLGSSTALELGIKQASGTAVVIPAAEIRSFPILPGDPLTDPYRKLAPITALDSSGRACAAAGASDVDTAGDIVLDATACIDKGPVTISIGSAQTTLQDTTLLQPGSAIPVRITVSPPNTGTATTPGAPAPPDTGSGAASGGIAAGGATWDAELGSYLVASAALALGALVLKRRARGRR